MRARRVDPEILDGLDVADPRAVASRRDLVRLNALMGHAAISAGLLAGVAPKGPLRILEIGAGDGAFALAVARRLQAEGRHGETVLLDLRDARTPRVAAGFAAIRWRVRQVTADAFRWLAGEGRDAGFDVVSANLFLHHFEDARLRELLALSREAAPAMIATEPRRDRFSLLSARCVGLIGANDVTRHDAPASVRAGFRDGELSALWPRAAEVSLDRRRGLFTQGFAARRVA